MQIKTTEVFKKGFKKLYKKDNNLLSEYEKLLQTLQLNPTLGTHISDGRYKIR